MQKTESGKDFFISYNHKDRAWAEWIAWTLEEEGYSTVIQAWDFLPGKNFALEMKKALTTARRVIAVLSPNYLGSKYAQAEWAAAFTRDPTGEARILVPVRIAPVELSGLDAAIVHIDLSTKQEAESRELLITAVREITRLKPALKPGFPGSEKPRFPRSRERRAPFIRQALIAMAMLAVIAAVIIAATVMQHPAVQTSADMKVQIEKPSGTAKKQSAPSSSTRTGVLKLDENRR
jgi:hypothetical protein